MVTLLAHCTNRLGYVFLSLSLYIECDSEMGMCVTDVAKS